VHSVYLLAFGPTKFWPYSSFWYPRHLRLVLELRHPFGIAREEFGQYLQPRRRREIKTGRMAVKPARAPKKLTPCDRQRMKQVSDVLFPSVLLID
jgi:hypothetical protein